jgi:hypothetical protein
MVSGNVVFFRGPSLASSTGPQRTWSCIVQAPAPAATTATIWQGFGLLWAQRENEPDTAAEAASYRFGVLA